MEENKNTINIDLITDAELYIDEEFKSSDKIDENSLKSLSWIDSVDEELKSSLDIKPLNLSNTTKKTENIINIDSIIKEKYDTLDNITVLEYQYTLINYIKKYLKINNPPNILDLVDKLQWIIDSSDYLGSKIGLNTFKHKINDNPMVLIRSSYKFCNYNFECQYNYNIKKHSGCYAQHYVHNLVHADINELKKFILHNQNNMNTNELDDIKKSVNTISFVINHMYEELKNAEKYNLFNNKNNHINRTPSKKKTKNINK